MTGIQSRSGATTSFGLVVRIVRTYSSVVGSFQFSKRPAKAKGSLITLGDGVRLLALADGLPLVKGIGGYQAAAGLVGAAKGRKVYRCAPTKQRRAVLRARFDR